MNHIHKICIILLSIGLSSIVSNKCIGKNSLILTKSDSTYIIDSTVLEKLANFNLNNLNAAIPSPPNRLYINNPKVEEEVWHRFNVTNNTSNTIDWILVSYFYTIDEIDILIVDSDGKFSKKIFRDTMTVYNRIIHHKQPTFSVSLSVGETKTIYIKVKNESTYEYEFGLFSNHQFFNSFFKEYILVGLFYGFMLFVLIYTLINYIFFRDNVILIYILFILAQTIHMLFRDGNGLFLLPNYTEYADLFKNLSRATISITILLYTLAFLKVPRNTVAFKFVIAFIIARIAYAAYMLQDTSILTFHFELFAILISTGLSIHAFIQKDTDAKYLVIGLTLMSITYFIFYLSVVWISAIGSFGFFLMYFGIAGESVFTTLALTERFKRIQLDNYKKLGLNQELEKTVTKRTELISLQNKLLEEQSAELNSFLYSASHDLSGPIKSIEGLLNLAEIDTEADPKQLYKMMREKLVILEANVADLNSVSTLKNIEKQLRNIDFNQIHAETFEKFHARIGKNDISITLNCTLNNPIKNDPYAIKAIYHQLLSNAIKFRDVNKISFLKITIEEKKGMVVITFDDNGIGIEEDKIDKIFNVFYRGTDFAINDTGLGLYIVQLAVKKLNGTIKVESTFGKGSAFIISFPL